MKLLLLFLVCFFQLEAKAQEQKTTQQTVNTQTTTTKVKATTVKQVEVAKPQVAATNNQAKAVKPKPTAVTATQAEVKLQKTAATVQVNKNNQAQQTSVKMQTNTVKAKADTTQQEVFKPTNTTETTTVTQQQQKVVQPKTLTTQAVPKAQSPKDKIRHDHTAPVSASDSKVVYQQHVLSFEEEFRHDLTKSTFFSKWTQAHTWSYHLGLESLAPATMNTRHRSRAKYGVITKFGVHPVLDFTVTKKSEDFRWVISADLGFLASDVLDVYYGAQTGFKVRVGTVNNVAHFLSLTAGGFFIHSTRELIYSGNLWLESVVYSLDAIIPYTKWGISFMYIDYSPYIGLGFNVGLNIFQGWRRRK